MESKIKYCPFCNNPKVRHNTKAKGYFVKHDYLVRCTKCGAKGPLSHSPEMATEAWNTRMDSNYAKGFNTAKTTIIAWLKANGQIDDTETMILHWAAEAITNLECPNGKNDIPRPSDNANYPWEVYGPYISNCDIGGPAINGSFACIATVFGGKADAEYIVALQNADFAKRTIIS